MGPYWQHVLGCLCLVVGVALSAAVPTPDTMVVARSDDGESSTTAATGVTEVSTEEASAPIKLTEMEVTSNIAMRYAHTAVVTRVRNPAKRAQEATFRVLLPETAFISSFTMILDGKPYKAYVKEKEEAKQIYNQAVSQGLGAAHVETKARDSNHFTVSVNVEANTLAVFNLTYEELLVRRNGVYNHAVNLHPGALVPKLTVAVHVRESQRITALRVPEVRTGNEVDATPEDAQNSKAVIDRAQNGKEATITFSPDLAEQQRLIDIYLEKTKETRQSPYRYGGYDDDEDDAKDGEAALGQFVVQYDVERPKDGEILVNDGYFVHFFAPSDLPPLNKYCVFVLDTSGSMMDRKIVQLREAMQTILSELHAGDYFSIVEFSSAVMVHELKEADQESSSSYPALPFGFYSFSEANRLPRLVPPSEATPENIAKAKVIVSRLQAAGGTNIYSALDTAVELIKMGVVWADNSTTAAPTTAAPTTAAPVTAGPITAGPATSAPLTLVPPTPAPEQGAPVKRSTDNTEEVPQLEPIIIFLTDGDPTVGQTDPTRIINHLTEKNAGMNKATIYSLAFGEDADRKFLRKLSLRNDGFMRHIYEAADAALQLRDFYRQVSSPLLADVKFVYPKKQVKADSLTKNRFRRYYSGAEAVVAGRVEDGAEELTPTVGAFCGVGQGGRKHIDIIPRAPVPVMKEHFLPLERLWAYLTVKQLLDERDARDPPADDKDDKTASPDKRALDIALKYSFVTPLTSLVVVKPNASDAIDAESVHKQNQAFGFGGVLPGSSASFSAVGRPAYASAFPVPAPMVPAAYRPQSLHSFSLGQSALYSSAPQAQTLSLDSYHEVLAEDTFAVDEEEDYDAGAPGIPGRPPLMPGLSLPPSNPTAQFLPGGLPTQGAPSTPGPLAAYHLQEFAWLSPLLAPHGNIEVPAANATVTLKLSTDSVAPRAAGGDEACAAAAGGAGAGVCVYLTRCAASRTLSAQTYPTFHCSVGEDRYAGVCCPKDQVYSEKTN